MKTPLPTTMRCLALAFAMAASGAALANPGGSSAEPAAAADPLDAVRELVKRKNWPAALAELKRQNATSNADWNNLMGFTLRKQTAPDLDGAQRHYDEALRLAPEHLAALEYAGELALMKGDLPRAENLLTVLARVCRKGCEEQADLDKAVRKFKADGNRYIP